MKNTFKLFLAFVLAAQVFIPRLSMAQAPQKMSYQAVIRDMDDILISYATVGMQLSILQGSSTGTAVYIETQTPTTNANGLATLEIGTGTVVTGDFSTINWADGPFFLMTEIDVNGGNSYTITGASELLSVPYAMHATTAETVTGGKYKVGDFAHGGIVFWVDETGQHGLVCAKEDQGAARWYAGTNGSTQAKGNGLYAGKANTSIIISSQVAIGDDGNTYAARMCNELQVTEDGVTYGDWYLPSIYELHLMYLNKVTINATAANNGGSAFSVSGNYWSSTEESSDKAIREYFWAGGQPSFAKNADSYVRAVRAF